MATSRQHVLPPVQLTPSSGFTATTTAPHSTSRRTGGSAAAPLSPNSEAARARARSLAASHAARISAANRRFRTEKAALDTRVASLVEELANRRRLSVKYMALQVQVSHVAFACTILLWVEKRFANLCTPQAIFKV